MTVFKIALVAACAAASSGIAQAEDLVDAVLDHLDHDLELRDRVERRLRQDLLLDGGVAQARHALARLSRALRLLVFGAAHVVKPEIGLALDRAALGLAHPALALGLFA